MKEKTMIFHNGHVFTADEKATICQAVMIEGRLIKAVGTDEEMLKLKQADTVVIDCQGKTLLPGIIDSHTHLWEYGILSEGVILFGIQDMETLRQELKKKVDETQPGSWIQGGSWIETQFAENRMPTRWDLDSVSPDNPVVLERIFGASSVNSKALEAAGITKDTPDPENGTIVRDENGEPTGVLLGQAVLLVRGCIPNVFGADDFGAGTGKSESREYEGYIRQAIPEYLKYGVTSIMEPGVSPVICKAYQTLRDRGELKLRVNLMPNWHGFTLKQQTEKFDRFVEEIGIYTGFGDEWLRMGGLKMAIDGGLTSKTALLSWPYKNEKNPPEVNLRLDMDRLDEWIEKAHNSGWAIGIHVMGDIALERAVDAIYKAYQKNPVKRLHHLVHCYYPTPDSLKKMQEAGIMVSVQPGFIYNEADGYEDLLTKEKREEFLPLKTYMENGIATSMSTDTPCASINPFWGLYSAVTRKGVQGYQLGSQECVSLAQGLKMMTIEGARLTGEAHLKGSLEPGKLADLCLLDRRLQADEEEALRDIVVDLTVLDGEIVYERNNNG